MLLEWGDRTRSLPGDEVAAKISESPLYEDKVAIQLPVTMPEGMQKPYFGMGDKEHPVNLWQWSSGTTTEPQSVNLLNAVGFNTAEVRANDSLSASGVYKAGTWRVVFKRKITTGSSDDLQFMDGLFIPIAILAWDGSAGETGSKHTLPTG